MEYLEQAKREIVAWENEAPGFLNQTADYLLWPAEKAAEALIPNAVQEAISKAIFLCLEGLASQTVKTLNADDIAETVETRAKELAGEGSCDLNQRLQAADEQAKGAWNYHLGYAVVEGGATGAGGFAGLAVDIPALFSILVREIQGIGLCYGFKADAEREREYLLHILQTGFASNVKVKMGLVVSLKEFEQILIRIAWKKMAEDLASKQLTKHSLLAALRQFAKSLGYQLTKRKALQLVPIVGALVGASLNGTLANDIGKAAYMSYRRRWIAENGGGGGELEV